MHAADAEASELGTAQPLGLLLGRPRLDRSRLDHERADDVCLPSRLEVSAEPPIRLGAPVGGHPARHDRAPPRRKLGNLAHGQVAVDGQRERAGDRGGRHVEHVRRPCGGERLPLLDAEPMLLVDDGDRHLAQVDACLDQRVRADDDARLERRLPLGLRHGARQQAARDARADRRGRKR